MTFKDGAVTAVGNTTDAAAIHFQYRGAALTLSQNKALVVVVVVVLTIRLD